jgi:2-polyprenyl-6-hydroxyphenyl methylase/3-demethylubiquinone-9 3-methyltransferase
MLQYRLLELSPSLLRRARTRLLIDLERLKQLLPSRGRLLDVGCGIGSLDYEIARSNQMLFVLGIDLSRESIDLARRYHSLPNIEYACRTIESIEGEFDCILFVDVFHHVPPTEYSTLLMNSSTLLSKDGYVLIKDIERRRGQLSLWADRYVSGCREVYLHDCDELASLVSKYMEVRRAEVKFRFPFPHYYIEAANRSEY